MPRILNCPSLCCLFSLALLGLSPACDGDGDEDSDNSGSSETGPSSGDGDGDGDASGDGDGDASTAPGDGDGDGDGDAAGDGDGDGAAPSFAAVMGVLENGGCTSPYCHGSDAGGLELGDAETSYANLVGVDAVEPGCDLQQRVVAGEPEQSILWLRVRPAAQDMGMACVSKMPQGSEGLDADSAQIIYDWIAGGAQP